MMPPVRAVALALLLALPGQLLAADKGASKGEGPPVGSVAPDFKARVIGSKDQVQLSALRGKVVVLTFWATWCGPCRKEVPVLDNIQRAVGPEQLAVLAVQFDSESGSALARLAEVAKMRFLNDPWGTIAGKYSISAIPHMFIIGRDGVVVANHLGYGEGMIDELADELNAALGRKSREAAVPAAPAPDTSGS